MMTLDEQLLGEAKTVRERLLDLQHEVERARVDYQHVIRRLHAAGGSMREIAEELGLDVDFSSLEYRGRERASRRFASGLVDREFHQVYVLALERPLGSYRPDPAEVIGLAAFPSRELVELAAGRLEYVAATEAVSVATDGRLVAEQVVVRRQDVVPYSAARLRRMLGARMSR
jgi:hypothetical protein